MNTVQPYLTNLTNFLNPARTFVEQTLATQGLPVALTDVIVGGVAGAALGCLAWVVTNHIRCKHHKIINSVIWISTIALSAAIGGVPAAVASAALCLIRFSCQYHQFRNNREVLTPEQRKIREDNEDLNLRPVYLNCLNTLRDPSASPDLRKSAEETISGFKVRIKLALADRSQPGFHKLNRFKNQLNNNSLWTKWTREALTLLGNENRNKITAELRGLQNTLINKGVVDRTKNMELFLFTKYVNDNIGEASTLLPNNTHENKISVTQTLADLRDLRAVIEENFSNYKSTSKNQDRIQDFNRSLQALNEQIDRLSGEEFAGLNNYIDPYSGLEVA